MAEVSLSRGLSAIVDDADLPLVLRHQWCATPSDSTYGGWYASTSVAGKTVYLHRLVMGAGEGQIIDHADFDGLNNRRSNLRLCSISQNNMHRRAWTSHGLKGVYRNGSYVDGSPRWRVFLDTPNGRIEGGSYRCRLAAATRYDELAAHHYGEFACLNMAEAA